MPVEAVPTTRKFVMHDSGVPEKPTQVLIHASDVSIKRVKFNGKPIILEEVGSIKSSIGPAHG
jgi:hypothetical protein